MMEHKHTEAFMLMTYKCEECGTVEIIWNSRDGVTPFMGPTCNRGACVGATLHENWSGDVYAPDYKPSVGERIWRDGTLDMMRDIKRRMVECNSEYLSDEAKQDIEAFIEKIAIEEHESQPGWPALIEAHTGKVDGL